MICQFCGNVIDDDSTVCPYCGSSASPYASAKSSYDDFNAGAQFESDFAADSSAGFEYDEEPVTPKKGFSFSMPKFSMPDFSSRGAEQDVSAPASDPTPGRFSGAKSFPLSLTNLLCAVSILLSIICLTRFSALNAAIEKSTQSTLSAVNETRNAVYSLDEKLSQMDGTIANVQSQAYNQYAGQAITITKDLTSLTGPVTAGKYNQMFIVNAKGNLNLNTSFEWQKFNEATRGWVTIVFTGTATSNEEYGLRIENSYDKATGTYISILWANGITPSAAGTYRCVITDESGITKPSSEAIVQVATE